MKEPVGPGDGREFDATPPVARTTWRSSDVVTTLISLGSLQLLQAALVLSHGQPDDSAQGQVMRYFPTGLTAYVVLMLAWRRGMRPSQLGFVRPRTWRPALYAWAGAVLTGPAYAAVLALFGQDLSSVGLGATIEFERVPWMALLLSVSAILVLAPVSEEVIFRGMCFSGLRRRYALLPALLLSGLLFSAFHLDAARAVPLVIIGALFAYAYERGGSLWCAILPHTALNAVTIAVTMVSRA